MTYMPRLKHLAFVLFLLSVLWLTNLVSLNPVAQVLQMPVQRALHPLADAESSQLTGAENILPLRAVQAAVMPRSKSAPKAEARYVDPATATTFQVQNVETPETSLPSLAPDEDLDLTEGSQLGETVPPLTIVGLTTVRVHALLAKGDVTLWVETGAGQRLWFVPAPGGIDSMEFGRFLAQGHLTGAPLKAGLIISGPENKRLREVPVTSGSSFMPLFLLSSVASRDAGALSLTRGGLRVTPAMEDRMIAAQQVAIAGLSGPDADIPPRAVGMTGCWDSEGSFVIAVVHMTATVSRNTKETCA